MEALSLDRRERIGAASDEHAETREEGAERFGVSRSFVQKLLRRRRVEGSIAARPRGGGAQPLRDEHDHARRRALRKAKPDATLAEWCRSLRAAGAASVSVPTMCRALAGLRRPLNKRRCTPASGRRRAFGQGAVRSAGRSRR